MQNHGSYLLSILAVSLCLASPFAATAAVTAKAAAPAHSGGAAVLNQKEIHTAYNEGDFDKVTAQIEAFNKANKSYSHADSIFVAKHLAVVYSANPQTREKGKYYMYRLLELMPSAELVDMFVSDEIDRIFEKVRKEFLTRQQGFGVDSTQISMPKQPATGSKAAAAASAGPASRTEAEPGPSQDFQAAGPKDRQPYWKRNGFWIAGGVGLLVAGTAAYFIYAQGDESTGKTIVIPAAASEQP